MKRKNGRGIHLKPRTVKHDNKNEQQINSCDFIKKAFNKICTFSQLRRYWYESEIYVDAINKYFKLKEDDEKYPQVTRAEFNRVILRKDMFLQAITLDNELGIFAQTKRPHGKRRLHFYWCCNQEEWPPEEKMEGWWKYVDEKSYKAVRIRERTELDIVEFLKGCIKSKSDEEKVIEENKEKVILEGVRKK